MEVTNDASINQSVTPEQKQPESDIEERTEKVAQQLQINLPGAGLSLPIRFIALFTLIGGMSIIGSMFADILNPSKIDLSEYIGRLIVGLLMITVAYGIINAQRWSVWLYGFIVCIGMLINPAVTAFPLLIVCYLIYKRNSFTPFMLDHLVALGINKLKNKFGKPHTTSADTQQ